MKLSDLISTYRRDTHDVAEPFFLSDEDVTALLNEAQVEACIRARLIFERHDADICEVDIESGVSIYDQKPSWVEIIKASTGDGENISIFDVRLTNRMEMSGSAPAMVVYDKTFEMIPPPTEDDTITVEVYRLPSKQLENDDDEPEIAAIHHQYLLDWVKFKAYSIPDADLFDAKKANIHEARFEQHFGKHPGAKVRKPQNANMPHVNRVW